MNGHYKILFMPAERNVYALPGTVLMEAAARAGIILQASCGGAGTCAQCVIRVIDGECKATAADVEALGKAKVAEGHRLACRATVSGPLTVEVPQTSLFDADTQILVAGDKHATAGVAGSAVRKVFRQLRPPEHGDGVSDADRLLQGMAVRQVRLDVLRNLPGVLRRSNFEATVVQIGEDVIAVEPGDTRDRCYGMAFDLGSTTLVGTLVDLLTGKELAVTARINSQTRFGDDVLSRIQLCRSEPDGLIRLQEAVVADVNDMIRVLLAEGAVASEHVYQVAVAGNTTMQQCFCGIDPSALGELPFVPAFNRGLSTDAGTLGLQLPTAATVFVFPQLGGFVGGDTVAGILAAGLGKEPITALLVDIGTNGEIALAHGGVLTATSVAAGPAFEGARIVRGMRATAGAIEKITLAKHGDLEINIIGNRPATGLCGSAVIDAAAELRDCGIMDETGRILAPDELPADLSVGLRARVRVASNGEPAVVLAHSGETANGEPICLYQKDVRQLQLANAAIRAGIELLLRRAGLTARDLSVIMLAGAFGNYIRRHNAVRIGMLPPLSLEHIRFIGNAASLGAKRVLLSSAAMNTVREIPRNMHHVDLSLDADFQLAFSEAMLFPDSTRITAGCGL